MRTVQGIEVIQMRPTNRDAWVWVMLSNGYTGIVMKKEIKNEPT